MFQAVKVRNYEHHLAGDCKGFYEDFNSPSKVTLRDVLSKPATLPTTEAEMKATSHLVRRVMNQQECTSQASSVVSIPTGGKRSSSSGSKSSSHDLSLSCTCHQIRPSNALEQA